LAEGVSWRDSSFRLGNDTLTLLVIGGKFRWLSTALHFNDSLTKEVLSSDVTRSVRMIPWEG
jgi:hypothetical protein